MLLFIVALVLGAALSSNVSFIRNFFNVDKLHEGILQGQDIVMRKRKK